MPLTKDEVARLKKSFKAARGKPCPFFYCVSGPEGAPVLMVDRRKISARETRSLRKTAKTKKFVRGTVVWSREEKRYVFSTLKAPSMFKKHLKSVFSKAVPELRRADVRLMTDKEAAAEGQRIASQVEQEKALEEGTERQLSGESARLEEERRAAEQALIEARQTLKEVRERGVIGDMMGEVTDLAQAKKAFNQARKHLKKVRKAEAAAKLSLQETRAMITASAEEARALRALSDDLLAQWNAAQETFWTEKRGDEQWRGEVSQATTARAEAAAVFREREAVRAEVAKKEAEVRRVLARGEEKRERYSHELYELTSRVNVLEGKSTLSLEEVEELEGAQTRVKRLRKRMKKLTREMPEQRLALEDLEVERQVAERRAGQARIQADIARERQESQLRSPEEAEMVSKLALEQASAQASLNVLDDKVTRQKETVAQLRASATALTTAEEALRAAQLKLHAAQMQRQQTEENTNLVSFWGWDNSPTIEAALKALPGAKEAESIAMTDFIMAQLAVEKARSSLDVDTQAIIAAERELSALQVERSETAREVARLDQQLADESAMVAGVAVDLMRQDLDKVIALCVAEHPLLGAANQKKEQAAAASAQKTDALAAIGVKVEQAAEAVLTLQEALKSSYDPDQLAELQDRIAALSALQAEQRRCRQEAEAALTAQSQAEAAFSAQLVTLGESDATLGGALANLKQAEADVQDSRQRSAQATREMVRCDGDQVESQRRARVVESQVNLHATIDDNLELLEEFAHMEDAADLESDIFVIDLLSEEDREKASAHPQFKALLALQQRLEQMALHMLRSGATAEELDAAFARVPNGLRPPSYRAEVAAFQVLDRTFSLTDEERESERVKQTARRVTRPAELRAEVMKQISALASAGLPTDVAEGALMSEPVRSDPDLLETVSGALANLQAGLANVRAGTVTSAQDLHAALADQLAVLQKAHVDVAAFVGPVLMQLAGPAAEVSREVMAAAVRKGQARHTALLARAAKVAGSPLAGAFEEALDQENRLWATHAVSATLTTTRIVGMLLLNNPGTVALGVALELGSFAGRTTLDIGQTLADWRLASKAKSLLAKARAGSARARAELMKWHPLYAKGLIVHMAQSGDPYAKMYMTKRGMDEKQIQASSLRIMTHYLLEEAEQLDENGNVKLETATEWFDRHFDALAEQVTGGISRVQGAIDAWQDPRSAAAFGELQRVLIATGELAGAFDRTLSVHTRMLKDQDIEALSSVNALLDSYRRSFSTARQQALSGLERLSTAERTMRLMERKQDTLEEDALEAMKNLTQALPRLRSGYLEVVGNVARAA